MSPEDAQALVSEVLAHGKATCFGVELEGADLEVGFDAKEGYAAAGDRIGVVVLDTRLTDELRDLGYLRELQNRIQAARKEMGLDFVDRIEVHIAGSARALRIAEANAEAIRRECLATSLVFSVPEPRGALAATGRKVDVDVEGDTIELWLAKV